jgi:hypothetical protein
MFSIGHEKDKGYYIKLFVGENVNKNSLQNSFNKAIEEIKELKKVNKQMHKLIPNLNELLKEKQK